MARFASLSITSFLGSSLLFMAAVAAFIPSALANTKISDAAKKNFADACLKAYLHSSPDAQAMGKQLCDCASREASSQGVRQEILLQETAKIRQNPKYEIKDKALLNSVQACFIDVYSQEVRKNLQAQKKATQPRVSKNRKPSPQPTPSPTP